LLEHNKGKPFFIAGHSQGALHGQRLVSELVSKTEIHKNLIAAYLIGYILPSKYFDEMFPDLSVAKSSIDQNVIISWCTGVEGFNRAGLSHYFGLLMGGNLNLWSKRWFVKIPCLGLLEMNG